MCHNYTDKEFSIYVNQLPSGFVAKGSAENGNIYDETGTSTATYSYFKPTDQEVLGNMLAGFRRTAETWLPVIEVLQPSPLPGGPFVKGVARGVKCGKALNKLRKAKWASGIIKYKRGSMTAIEHVVYRHGFNSGFKNVGKFASKTTLR